MTNKTNKDLRQGEKDEVEKDSFFWELDQVSPDKISGY